MGKRHLHIEWRKIPGANPVRKKLRLLPNESGIYKCVVDSCLHLGFKSKRGCRKHVDTKHGWYFYFESLPVLTEGQKKGATKTVKANTMHQPSYSIDNGIGLELQQWLCTPCGGGKKINDSKQSSRRAMKFLMSCSGGNDEDLLKKDFIDCCVGSPSMITDFLNRIQNEWGIGSAGCYTYLKSIIDLMDYRKAHGVKDDALRSFAVTEVYLRRGLKSIRKDQKAEWTRNLTLETLIAKDSWATIEEMEKVIPFHLQRFKSVIDKCAKPSENVNVQDLTFLSRFVITLMFLKVKCTRPMTYQFLTVEMIETAKKNGGYIDQTDFKTSTTYKFDTIILDKDVLKIIDLYVTHVRPRLHPKCNFVFLNTNGAMQQNLCNCMSILVHQAIGKYIHPTRYRQIVETESVERLSAEDQQAISKDQKHSSHVAQVHYQKKLSREVAEKGKECMQKLTSTSRTGVNEAIAGVLSDIESMNTTFDLSFLEGSNTCNVDLRQSTEQADVTITDVQPSSHSGWSREIKEEELATYNRTRLTFTDEEDKFLQMGIKKYGRGNWAKLLADKALKFNPSRTRCALRIRADTAGFKRKYNV